MPWLAFEGSVFPLEGGDVAVGDGAEAAVRVADVGLRPRHFVIRVEPGRASVSVRPYSPECVVAVNGRQVDRGPHRLLSGDVIDAGAVRFLYSADRPDPRGAPPATPPARPHLIDVMERTARELTDDVTGIGRDTSNAIIVRDATASRFHAEIRREAGGWALHSTGATGTYLNGKRLDAPRLLQNGDEIEVAYTVLRFVTGGLPEGIRVAGAEPVPADDRSRRPTMARERVTEGSVEADAVGTGPRGVTVAVWVILAVAAALTVWAFIR